MRRSVERHGNERRQLRLHPVDRPVQDDVQVVAELGANQLRQPARRHPAALLQKAGRRRREMQHVPPIVDEDAGRRRLLERCDVHLAGGRAGGGRRLALDTEPGRGGRGEDRGQLRTLVGRIVAHGEDAMLVIDGLEQLVVRHLRRAQEQIALVAACVPEDGDDVLLEIAIEIDQQIAARDEVQSREGRIAKQTVNRKDQMVANFALDAIVILLGAEEPLQPFL